MEPEISASSCDVALESALLMLVQDVARGVGESDDTIASQLGAVEGCGVLGVVEGKPMPLGESAQRRNRRRDRIMAEACCPGEDEDALGRCCGWCVSDRCQQERRCKLRQSHRHPGSWTSHSPASPISRPGQGKHVVGAVLVLLQPGQPV
jgi:hypothetical protein